MKNKILLLFVTSVGLLCFPKINFGQTITLGTAANFVFYTITGAVSNAGASNITGDIGTNGGGSITGFDSPPSTVNGSQQNANGVTAQCSTDVMIAYNQLLSAAITNSSHAPAFGSGETIPPGVYSIGGAGSVTGDLNLDAQLDPNAIFIFKFGGALTTGDPTRINLVNGALACNVYWITTTGAIPMAANTIMRGTLIANNGAISMAVGGFLEGRMISTNGPVSFGPGTAAISPSCSQSLPVNLLTFTGTCAMHKVVLKWSTATEINNLYFTVERSENGINWHPIGTLAGAGNSSGLRTYSFMDSLPGRATSFYRLMQTDVDGNHKYEPIVSVKKCGGAGADDLTLYPNPSGGKFDLLFSGDKTQVYSIEVFNSSGKKVYASKGFQSKFDLSNESPGIYFLRFRLNSITITRKFVVEK